LSYGIEYRRITIKGYIVWIEVGLQSHYSYSKLNSKLLR